MLDDALLSVSSLLGTPGAFLAGVMLDDRGSGGGIGAGLAGVILDEGSGGAGLTGW